MVFRTGSEIKRFDCHTIQGNRNRNPNNTYIGFFISYMKTKHQFLFGSKLDLIFSSCKDRTCSYFRTCRRFRSRQPRFPQQNCSFYKLKIIL
ncbi:hypothetical protein HanIR_Chr01g0016991 [Helianthus annuus]|nr:hypothetical protein HanIR_Chr01g0016991 [Helianthus annuus]